MGDMGEMALQGMHARYALGAWLAVIYICALGELCREVLPLGKGYAVSRETTEF